MSMDAAQQFLSRTCIKFGSRGGVDGYLDYLNRKASLLLISKNVCTKSLFYSAERELTESRILFW
jgi:hypothetical protein